MTFNPVAYGGVLDIQVVAELAPRNATLLHDTRKILRDYEVASGRGC